MLSLKNYMLFLDREYPFLEPCVNCEYWRYLSHSGKGSGYFYALNSNGKRRTFDKPNMKVPDVCCHYGDDMNEPKPDGAYDCENGTCTCFTPRMNHYCRNKKVRFVRGV